VTTPVDGGDGDSGTIPLPTTALVYAGGNQNNQGAISVYRLTYATGALELIERVNAGQNAGFLAFDVPHRTLFDADDSSMRVRRFTLDAQWVPRPGNDVAATGNPVHIWATKAGDFVLTAQYNEAKVESFPVTNGAVGASLGAKNAGGQSHAVVLSPDERFAFVPCKAADRIERYDFDKATGALGNTPAQTQTANGAGPRHFAFHPNGAFAYLVNELNNTVYAYSYAAANGALTELQRIGTLPSGSGASTGAEIFVTPSGKDVYASNRLMGGQNGSLAMFRVGADGKLTANGHQSTGGRIPRSFAIDPTGRFVIAANQESRTLGVLAIDQATGKLGEPRTTDIGLTPSYVGILLP
jgi:6-phosphogluconolactonase